MITIKSLSRIFVCASLTTTVLATHTPAARAHAEVEAAIPTANSTVTESPKQLTLKFSEQIQIGTSVKLKDANGNTIALSNAMLDEKDPDGKTFVATVPNALSNGQYTVEWKSFSVDGHTESGKYSFKVELASAAAAPTAAPTAAPVPTVTIAPTAVAKATATAVAVPAINNGNDIVIRFALKAGKEDVICGKDLSNLGLRQSKPFRTQITDARLYLSKVRLVTMAGKEVALQLKADGKWQSQDVALLDFEDGKALCKDSGTPETRNIIEGTIPAGQYSGLAFQLGVPFEVNHADVAMSQAPLNVQALWWNWQGGYKFARIDLRTNMPAPNNDFFIHLGSTGCGEAMMDHSATPIGKSVTGTMTMSDTATTETPKMDMSAMNKPPAMPCKNPNTVQVKLSKFDPSKDVVVVDLAGLTNSVDIAHPKPQPAGCMSGTDDPDCNRLFPNLGLSLSTGNCTGNCRAQRVFRVEAAAKP